MEQSYQLDSKTKHNRCRERCEELAEYLIEKQTTVREAAVKFGISKSTVHKDVTEHLKRINPGLFAETRELLEKNKSERHLRGGEATKQKYLKKSGDNQAFIQNNS